MSEWWHKIEHHFGWVNGRVVSMTTPDRRVLIGFQCDACGLITGVHDCHVDRLIDRAVPDFKTQKGE